MIGLFTSCFGEADECGHYGYGGGRRPGRRGVTKAMISPPSNFVHTGHLGIGTVQSGDLPSAKDPEKLKTLMSQVSAALDHESVFGAAGGAQMQPQTPALPSAVGVAY
ncbi:hypothetical protein H4R18_004824 [Coemansia javaensis]|uniref:CRIB domain-containing protein n=1 Tax=Coemansia javaensis TaxID=2761396 RepID=A0A9W8LFR0_9FUNG|nr:hypothetical protein H4R18_004824 [Coemansia javaensis]